jgi:hypothetical protein
MDWLMGKKTYAVAIIWGLATAAQMVGWLTPESLSTLEKILLPLGLVALRAGVTKSGP